MTEAARTSKVAAAAAEPRQAPGLVVLIPYEETPSLHLVAIGADDRARLLSWLRRSRMLDRLPLAVADFLDEAEKREQPSSDGGGKFGEDAA